MNMKANSAQCWCSERNAFLWQLGIASACSGQNLSEARGAVVALGAVTSWVQLMGAASWACQRFARPQIE